MIVFDMIKDAVKKIIGFLFRFSGIPFLIREILCQNKATIIFYHNPVPSVFKNHIEYLSKHYNFIPLISLVDAISNKNWADIPPKALVITIDDGHKDNYKLLDLIKTYHIYPTIYLCSHIVNTNRRFWFEMGLPNSQKLKIYNNNQRLKLLKDEIGFNPKMEYLERQALNLKEIEEMLPYVDFQSHSKYHPILITCIDEECKEEIEGSKKYLENLLNRDIKHFSFPNGDYTEREINFLKNCCYRSARTLDIGWSNVNSDPYRLKSMCVDDNASINILCAQINGLFGYFRYLLHGNLNGKHPPFL